MEAIILCDTKRDNLQISWDDEDGFALLFTPDMADPFPHYHIELTEDQTTQLALFLNKKLEELSAARNEG